jgi:integrase
MVRAAKRRGKRVLVIDISYRTPDGSRGRYRRDAEVQTHAAAQAEERRRLAALATSGSPFALVDETAAKIESARAASSTRGVTFGETVTDYLKSYAPTQLKASSRVSYGTILHLHLLPRLGNRPLRAIDATAVRELDAKLVEAGASRPLRRQIQTVLRSVVRRFAVEAKLLPEPPNMPPLPKKSTKIPEVLSAEAAMKILAAARRPEHRLVMLLAFHAGLRGCEIRGLRGCDVDIDAKVLRVRQAVSYGIVDTPKSGHDREVPLTGALCDALREVIGGRPRDARVALTAFGKPWGQNGLRDMFLRVARRAEIEGTTFHHLRHGFVTALFDRGVGAHVVRELAGHADLATTERYAHVTAKSKQAAIATLEGMRVAA